MAPSSAPMSGRASSRESDADLGRGARRCALAAGRCGLGHRCARDGRAAARRPPASSVPSAFPSAASVATFAAFALLMIPGPVSTGCAVPDRVQVRDVEHREDDRQVALEVLLLVDREQHPARLDLLDRAADVERPGLRALREHVEARDRHVGIEAEEAVERLVRLERRLHLRLRARDVGLRVRDRQHLDARAAEDLLHAVGALREAGVARLVDHDQHLLRAGRLELLAGALTGDVLGLADVHLVRRAASRTRRGPELTVMISMPFFEAVVSGPLSALASGTEVAITLRAGWRSRR